MTCLLGWTCFCGAQTDRSTKSCLHTLLTTFTFEVNYVTRCDRCDPFMFLVSRVEADGRCLCPSPDCCYWSLQHVYCLYTTEEAHLVMPSLPVSICAHQRELASKIKTESKTLLYDSILSIVPNRLPHHGMAVWDCICICRKRLSFVRKHLVNHAVFEI